MQTVFDIEADNLVDDVTKVHCMSFSIDGEEPECHTDIATCLAILDKSDELIGHNIIGYDFVVLRKLFHWKPAAHQKIIDTLPLSQLVWPDIINKDMALDDFPKKFWGKYSLRSFGHRMNLYKGDVKSFSFYTEEMAEYCNQDVRITTQLFEMLKVLNTSADAADLEMRFAQIAQDMHENGIAFNEEKAYELLDKLEGVKRKCLDHVSELVPPTVKEMKTPEYWEDTITGVKYPTKISAPAAALPDLKRGPNKKKVTPFNPNSRQQVAKYLMSQGWKPINKTNTGQPRVDEGTLTSIKDIPAAKVLADLYRCNKMLGMLADGNEAWLKVSKLNARDEPRIHPTLKTLGAISGRTSCVRPNLQQVPSARLPYGKECRQLFCAGPGYTLVGCDAKSLEVRCFAHYMAKYDSGDFAHQVVQGDVHQANADMMNCDRQTAKNTFFALIYGASPKKIAKMLDIDLVHAENLVSRLFRERPAMRHLINAVKTAAERKGYLQGLDGRKLIPRSPHSSVNLLVQAAGACVSKKATLNMGEAIVKNKWGCLGVKFVGFIHDEVLIEAPLHKAQSVLDTACASFRHTTEQFNLRCPMDGEGAVGATWYDIH
jgi:DNA polymerase I-like protein with 3'-5' exonuclease and polymerase domains